MNTQLLQKCIDKLSEKRPNIPYVLGMLETLKEMGSNEVRVSGNAPVGIDIPKVGAAVPAVEEMTDEEKSYYALMAGGGVAPMRDGGGE